MSTPEPDTDQLLEQCRGGDAAARDRLFSRHRERLKRMVMAHLDPRLAGRLDPSDVVQDALGEAAQELAEYIEGRPLPFYPWLRRIAWERLMRIHRNHIHTARRSVTRERSLRSMLPDDSVADLAARLVAGNSSPSEQAIRQEIIRRVREAIDALSLTDRELIILRYVERSSIRDIAAVLNTTEGAVKTRHFRAIKKLHQLLQ